LRDEASLGGDEPEAIPPIDVVPRDVTALDAGERPKRLPRSQRLFAEGDAV
jgi:hypothetical protein